MMKLVTSLVAVMALFGFSGLLALLGGLLLGKMHVEAHTANLEGSEGFCDTCQHDGKEWDDKPCSDCSDTDSRYEKRNCESCRHCGLRCYEEPCSSCSSSYNRWEAIS